MRWSLSLHATVLALVASVLLAPQASAQAQAPAAPSAPTVSVGESPSEVAARTGQRVEVTSERTATETTFANPDGTYTLEQSSAPVRGRTADGTWQPIDLTLERRADGVVAPHAPALDVVFSGGGAAPLVRLVQDGHVLVAVAVVLAGARA